MKELNLRGLLPDVGLVAVLGKFLEEPLIRALAYEIVDASKNIGLVPVTPEQLELAQKLGIPVARGYPDYFFFEADREMKEGFFSVGGCKSPMLLRLFEMGAEKVVVILRNKYHTISVEYASHLSEMVEPIISLYGEIVARRESPIGTTVVDIVPSEEDVEELRRLLKEIPGVVEVGIVPSLPYKRIFLREL